MFLRVIILLFVLLGIGYKAMAQTDPIPNSTSTATTSSQIISTTTPIFFIDGDENPITSQETPGARAERIRKERLEQEKSQQILAVTKQERIIKLASNMSYRMDATVDRFYNIISRLEQRAEKMKLAKFDTSKAATEIQKANQTLAEAKSELATIDKLVYGATTSQRPISDWRIVKETYFNISGLLRRAQSELGNGLLLLKTAPIIVDTLVSTTTESTITE